MKTARRPVLERKRFGRVFQDGVQGLDPALGLVPLLGILAYLSLRPPVGEINQATLANQSKTDNQLITKLE